MKTAVITTIECTTYVNVTLYVHFPNVSGHNFAYETIMNDHSFQDESVLNSKICCQMC